MTTTACIYARISEDKRKGTSEEGASVEAQVEACTKFILGKGWTVGRVYRDNSKSATTGYRPEFEQMLEDKPKIVVAFKQDRLSRQFDDTLRIKASGITGYLCDGGMLDFSSADAEMMSLIRSVVDSTEQRKKSERQKLRTLSDAKSGKYRGSIRPFGQELDGTWVEEEANAVIEAAGKIVTGEWSFFRTAKHWNSLELFPPKTGKQGGRQWTGGTVSLYFSRPRLMGFQDYEGQRYPLKNWKPLLTEKQWYAIQSIRDAKKIGGSGNYSGNNGSTHMLTKVAVCNECNRGMNISYRGGPNSLRYYKCPTAGHTTVNADKLEEFVAFRAYLLLLAQDTTAQEKTQEERSERLEFLMGSKIQAETDHAAWLEEALEVGMSPKIIQQKDNKHEEIIGEIQAEIVQLREDLTQGYAQIPGTWPKGKNFGEWKTSGIFTLSREAQRDLMRSLFKEVRVRKVGQGVRFSAERVELVMTTYGEQLRDRPTSSEEDWDSYWENLKK